MVGRRREAPDAGQVAERERQQAAQPDPKSSAGFLGFLDTVLGSEVKTRRLGYLVWQFAGGMTFVLVALAGLGYMVTYKASIEIKTVVGVCSIIMVTTGSFGLRRRRAKRLTSGIKPGPADQGDEDHVHS